MEVVEVFPSVESRIGGHIVYVRFFNLTQWPIDIIWMRSSTTPTKYATLKERQWIDIQTFEGHPWIFRRSSDGAPMVINKEQIYWPKTVARNCIVRESLFITTPMMSLTELAARRLLLPGSTFTRNLFDKLPSQVQNLIVSLKSQERAYRSSPVAFPLRTPTRPPPAVPQVPNEASP